MADARTARSSCRKSNCSTQTLPDDGKVRNRVRATSVADHSNPECIVRQMVVRYGSELDLQIASPLPDVGHCPVDPEHMVCRRSVG